MALEYFRGVHWQLVAQCTLCASLQRCVISLTNGNAAHLQPNEPGGPD